MNAVVTQARALKMLALIAVLLGAGWAAYTTIDKSSTSSLAGALRQLDLPFATALAADTLPKCDAILHSSSGRGAEAPWQSVELQVLGEARTSSDIGHATISVLAADSKRRRIHWSSNIGVSALILRGERGHQIRRFDHARFGGLDALDAAQRPTGPIERVTFCYGFELTVNKDVNTEFTRTYAWSLNHHITPEHWALEPKSTGTSTYRIQASRDRGTPRDWRAYGTITIDNLTPVDATIAAVYDQTDDGITSTVDCGVPLPGYVLKSGASLNCRYHSELPDGRTRATRTRVETVDSPVRGAAAAGQINFGQARVHTVAESVRVRDSSGRSWTFQQSGSASYQRVFRCDDDAGIHPWAAQIDGVPAEASAAVTVDCLPNAPAQTSAHRTPNSSETKELTR